MRLLLALLLTACGVPEDLELASASQAQIDPQRDYTIVALYGDTGVRVAQILAARTAHGTFEAGREYWHVNDLAGLRAARTLRWVNTTGERDWPAGEVEFPYSFDVEIGRWTATSGPRGTLLAGRDASGETLVSDFSGLAFDGRAWSGRIRYWYTTGGHYVVFGPDGTGAFDTRVTNRFPRAAWVAIESVPGR